MNRQLDVFGQNIKCQLFSLLINLIKGLYFFGRISNAYEMYITLDGKFEFFKIKSILTIFWNFESYPNDV